MKKRDLALLILSLALAVFGAVQLIVHISGTLAGNRTDQEMREIYRAEENRPTAIPTLPPRAEAPETSEATEEAAAETAEPSEDAPAETDAPEETGIPRPARIERLKRGMYPDNPGLRISERFRNLRKGNSDIVGWLTIGKIQDEAVTQRDNEFYMDHDVSGRKNVSGAIFLDQLVTLRSRPYTLILYGHNMRDESRFGWLRKYENPDFYRKNLFIEFNTIYEDGQYVVFSEGTVSTEEGDPNYLDFFGLDSLRVDERERAIGVLQNVSVLDGTVDVQADDQILLLVTCVDKDTDRRIVAARRVREGEDPETLSQAAGGKRSAH